MMTPNERLLQRALDGALDRHASAAAEHLDAPRLAALRVLDGGLKELAAPVREQRADLQASIVVRLPAHPPQRQVRVRALDLIYAAIAATVVVVTYGILGTAVKSQLQMAIVLSWAVGLSMVAGMALMCMPGLLRAGESGLLSRLLGKPVAIGPADVLVYRAVGASLVVAGLWLAH